MKLFQLLDKYLAIYDQIHERRTTIKELTQANQVTRGELRVLRKEIKKELEVETETKSLYVLCLEQYGKIDKHFHALYALFGKK